MPNKKPPEPNEPRGPVEIIPPGFEERRDSRVWIWTGSQRVKTVELGPVGKILFALTVAALSVLGFVFMAGVFLLVIPVVLALAIAFYLFGGAGFRRLR